MELIKKYNETADTGNNILIDETDVLYLILQKIQKTNNLTIKLTYKEILDFVGQRDSNSGKLDQIISLLKKRVFQEEIIFKTEFGGLVNFVLFTMIQNEPQLGVLIIKTQQEIMPILSDLATFFTPQDLASYLRLKNNYSKAMFRLVKKNTANRRIAIGLNEIKKLLGISKDYPDKNIYSRIIKPIKTELSLIYPELDISPIRYGDANGIKNLVHGKGSKIVGYNVSF